MSLLILWIETHMQAHLNKLVTWFSIFLLHHTSRDKKTSYFSCFSAAEKSVFFFLLAFFLSFLWLGYTSAIFSFFNPSPSMSLFQRGEERAAFGHQAGAWKHGRGAQEASARGNATSQQWPSHAYMHTTHKHSYHFISPSPAAPSPF